jgi:hypothetical protein
MSNGFNYLWVEIGRVNDTSTLSMDLPNGGRLYRYHNGRNDVMVYAPPGPGGLSAGLPWPMPTQGGPVPQGQFDPSRQVPR